jgi:hypothetical protein
VVANISNTLDITARAARILGEGNIYDPPNLVELRRIGIIGRSAELKMPYAVLTIIASYDLKSKILTHRCAKARLSH